MELDHDTQAKITVESFKGALAYGRLGLVFLFAMSALAYGVSDGNTGLGGMFLATMSAGLAYASQCFFTCGAGRHGVALMTGSLVTAIASGVSVVWG